MTPSLAPLFARRTIGAALVLGTLAVTAGCIFIGGTTGPPFDTVAEGTWTASDGGTLTLNSDGTGSTNAPYLIDFCDDTMATTYTLIWEFQTDPDVSYDTFAMVTDSGQSCNVNTGHSILSVTQDGFVFGNAFLEEAQTFTRE